MRQKCVLSALLLSASISVLAAGPAYTVRMLPLPSGLPGGIYMDYLAYDPGTGFVWAPAGNTGAVDVVNTATGKVRQIADFPTAEVQVRDRKRVFGPTSATVGEGVVYIGNRADYRICAVNARTLAPITCGHIDSMPDGLAYVAPTKEVWVTAPRDNTIRILDAKTLVEKAKLTFEGNPEGFAVDAKGGRFYTNLEDKDRTLAIDLKTHQTIANWNPSCGSEGPHGLRFDGKTGFLFVACSARAEVLDAAHDGKVLSSVDTGDGVDDIDYSSATHMLYVGAAKAGKLTVARVDRHGKLTVVAEVPTHAGARNGVVTRDGTVYLAHGGNSDLTDLVVVSPKK
jgi:DNA-binding beta-propeller fold protein YncE